MTSGFVLVIPLGACGPGTFDERGLLGLAFHPNFDGARSGPGRGLFYTYTSESETAAATLFTAVPAGTADHQNVVTEWQAVDPANPSAGVILASRRVLIRVNWPEFNHDGGDLAFGPDGKLYISMGDGGGADDADGQADIVARPKHPEQTGLPTPCTVTAPIFGHQGDGNAQKLNVPLVVKGGNFGWNLKEGTMFFHINGNNPGFASPDRDPARTIPPGLIDPIAQYDT